MKYFVHHVTVSEIRKQQYHDLSETDFIHAFREGGVKVGM